MKFFMLSDLHLGKNVEIKKAKEQLSSLCSRIRADSAPAEEILFVVMGDIIDKSDTDVLGEVRLCLNCIQEELSEYKVYFEFVPGNHDLPDGDISYFDSFIAEYGAECSFGNKGAYSRIYGNVNFIFADSNILRNHRSPGKIDIDSIRSEVKNMQNLVFCHHGFTHSYGGNHDTIENGQIVLRELEDLGIEFAFHGHTHRADATAINRGIVEIGCGTAFKDISDMDGIQNQFSVGYIREGKVVRVERFVISKDGGNVFPRETVYPEQQIFSDPQTIGKKMYEAVPAYIPRKVLTHTSRLEENFRIFIWREKRESLFAALMRSEKVLFLSDAGMGKSVEMENLAYELCQTLYFPILLQLRNYTGSTIERMLPKDYINLSPHYIVLLFDGYDELPLDDRRRFEKQLNLYVESNPDIKIVISSRSNFCKSEKDNQSRTFPGFQIYDLCELLEDEIKAYVEMKGIDYVQFEEEARTAGIHELLNNPFYLTKVSNLFSKEGTLPQKSVLMDKLIEDCFDVDDRKFLEKLEDNYQEFMCLLEKVSFAMQLMQQSKFDDRSEYQKLFTKQERELITYSGLVLREGDSWRFVHNNFREYLTARYLSKIEQNEVIEFISSDNGINPSWVNTLGYLMGIPLEWNLTGWIMETSPNVLVKFEADRVDDTMRYAIFTKLFSDYEEKNLWLLDELYNEEQLAHFAESNEALTFLLEKIARPVCNISQNNAVSILRYFRILYGRQNEIRTCLLRCCSQYPKVEGNICRLAILALCELQLGTPEVTKKLMTLFKDCDNDYVRLGLYEYLIEVGEQNEYVEYFLEGICYIVHGLDMDSRRVSNEAYRLVEGLNSMSTADSISAVMRWFASDGNVDFYNADEVYATLSAKAAQLYQEGKKEMYDIMIQCCRKAMYKFRRRSTRECIVFFEETGTLEQATIVMVEQFSDNVMYLTDLFHTCPEALGHIYTAYSEERFNNHYAFRDIVQLYAMDDTVYYKYAEEIKRRSGIQLPERKPKVNHNELQRKGEQDFFNALFCREELEKMLKELVNNIGEKDLLARDLFDKSLNIPWYSYLNALASAIHASVINDGGDGNWYVRDFLTKVNFERFTVEQSMRLLKGKTAIVVTLEQKEMIRQTIVRWLERDVLQKEVWRDSESTRVTSFVRALVYLVQFLDLQLMQKDLLELTLIPYYWFGEDRSDQKYKYIMKYVSLEKLKERIEWNLKSDDLEPMLLRDHIEFCIGIKSEIATTRAISICQEDTAEIWLRSVAVEYLYELYGGNYICKQVLPYATGELLVEMATKYKDISLKDLCCAMEREYDKTPTNELLASLISLGSTKGIEAYVSEVEKKNSVLENVVSPKTPTGSIRTINNPVFLPILVRLMDVMFNPKFVDNDFFGLRSSLLDAFINCGKIDADATIEIIEKHRINAGDVEGNIRFCNYIIEEVNRYRRRISDKPRKLQEVKLLLGNMK